LNRRNFLHTTAGAAAALLSRRTGTAAINGDLPLGLNTYCLRAMRWNDLQLIDYAASLKLDAVFLQDSLDPQKEDPAHWRKVKDYAAQRGLHLESAALGAVLPKDPAAFDASVRMLQHGIDVAVGMGSPIVRCLHASDRDHLPPGSTEQHIGTAIKLFKAVRSRALDAGVKFAIENHKDFQAWEMRQVIEGAGTDFVGSYLDTGNPVFVMEDPLTTVDVLGPFALTVHLRDSVIYETPRGAAVQWVPLGEGVVDFKRLIARVREVCKSLYVYVKPITGRPPQVLPYLDPAFWKSYPKARASDFARFLALAKAGHPYEQHVVIEDLPGKVPEAFLPAIQYQQREHMERSVAYAKDTLGLGRRWRT
jgi:sugar phosphate isomerase/epimerase